MIYVPSNRWLDAQDPMVLKPRVRGFITLEARSRYGLVLRSHTFENLITDNGIDGIGARATGATPGLYNFIQVGTGNATPSFSDTTLTTYTAGQVQTAMATSNSGPSDYYSDSTRTYTFTLGAVVANLAEIGAAGSSTTGNLFSRALIVDEFGTPTTFPVLADEQLVCYYTVRTYPPLSDATGTININASPYDYTVRAIAVTAVRWAVASDTSFGGANNSSVTSNQNLNSLGTGSLAAITAGTPSYTSAVNPTTQADGAYTPNSLLRDCTITWSPASFAGTRNVLLHQRQWTAWQILYDPPIAKTADQQLQLAFRLSWDRYTP